MFKVCLSLIRRVTLGAAIFCCHLNFGPGLGFNASDAVAGISLPQDGPFVYQVQDDGQSELRDFVSRYSSDRAGLRRRYDVSYSPVRRSRMEKFYQTWQHKLNKIDFDALGVEGRIDYLLLANKLNYELELIAREKALYEEMMPLIPFTKTIIDLAESRRNLEPADPPRHAAIVAGLPDEIQTTQQAIAARMKAKKNGAAPSRIVALRAARALESSNRQLKDWFEHFSGYDPLFTWWVNEPFEKAAAALKDYTKFLNEDLVGMKKGEDPPIVGDPIGTEGMRQDLIHEVIPYSPEELIAIAEREFAWCEREMNRASRDLGFGGDWKKTLEYVKNLHVEPGRQSELVRDLAREAVAFLQERDLVTIPPLADEIWRLEMMSPEMQKFAPFFLGGEVIRVSFPTDGMPHDDKMMSLRGNNIHFSRATVQHELIPGHHLQGFMTQRYNTHRRAFSTPFWGEGWALYWEMLLWDLGFPKTAEDRVGMLFWRSHRAARIIFSLSFHLGRMTPQECIDFLVDRVGHERANATAEVRRSFNGGYSPLYQVAYMIGGLQIRALHEELVASGKMTNREFHDAILQGGRTPIEMVRARLTGHELSKDFRSTWRFYGNP